MSLYKNEVIVAIEKTVEQQVEASGITGELHRLDGEKIVDAIIEQLEGFVLVPEVISDEWMEVFVEQKLSEYCKSYEELPFSVKDEELPDLREDFRLPIRNAHKRLMLVIEAKEKSHDSQNP